MKLCGVGGSMIAVNLKINEYVYEKIMYFLNSLPKSDVEILYKKKIEEIEPTSLPKDDFDYIEENRLKEIDELIKEAKKDNFKSLKTFDELKNEL